MTKRNYFTAALFFALLIGACGDSDEMGVGNGARATPVTVVAAQTRNVEVTERTVGRLEADTAPVVSAETSGRVVEVLADVGMHVSSGQHLARLDDEAQGLRVDQASAAVDRMIALKTNADSNVARFRDLIQRESAAANLLDNAEAQQKSLTAQLAEARAALANAKRELARTWVVSPVDGIVQSRLVARGDFVATGSPLFEVVRVGQLKAYLPFPERLAQVLEPGMTVHLSRPFGQEEVTAPIADMRPMVGTRNRAVEAIVDLAGKAAWPAQGSVNAVVTIVTRADAVTVPSLSVVRRPAGKVVYVLRVDNTVEARSVHTGVQSDGWIEIQEGVNEGEKVVESGAGFLTDGAAVTVRDEG